MPTSVPAKVAIPALGLQTAVIDLSDETFTITATNDGSGFNAVVGATPTLSAGTSFTKGKFRNLIYYPDGIPTASSIYDAYVARFGVPTAGANISVEVKLIAETGQAGLPETLRVTVQA